MSESNISNAQLKANRENAKKSTGPTSEDGKNKSRMNGRKHGFTGQVLIETEEEHEAFVAFSNSYLEELAPVGIIETDLAHAIVIAAWRRHRTAAGENNYLSLRLAAEGNRVRTPHAQVHTAFMHADTLFERSKDFCNIALYEQRLTNTYQKNMKLFLEMKENRLLNQTLVEPKAMASGASSQPDYQQHEEAEPSTTSGRNGFAFSNEEAPMQPEPETASEPLKFAS